MLSRFLGERVGNSRALLESLERYCHPPQIDMARHNARLYGVEHRVLFVLGDALGQPVR